MKALKTLIVALCACALVAGAALAETKPAAKEAAKTCCEKAKADGKQCTHPCCVKAAKDGKTCEKCNPKKDDKKKEEKK